MAARILKTALMWLGVLLGVYLAVAVGVALWMFEVKLKRWPLFVYGTPFSMAVGDDIEKIALTDRLERLGYSRSSEVIPGPGQWSLTGPTFRICLAPSPIPGKGIASGPVELSLDWKRITGIRLLRSQEEVSRLTIEPELLDVFPGEGGEAELCRYLPLDLINPLLAEAVLLTEDTRFFSHQGVDPLSMVDAAKANLKAWKYLHGASTVTQQLVRMTILSPRKTLLRKLNEMGLALIADLIYRKERILETYLNRVYLGQWASYPVKGVAEASRVYFGKDQSELSPSEAAFIAASIRAPNVITPFRHPDRALGRRNMVLGLLLKSGKISREDYDHAISTPVIVRRGPAQLEKPTAFLKEVRALIARERLVGPDGRPAQDVLTSFDPFLQRLARKGLSRFGSAGRQAFVMVADPHSGALLCLLTPNAPRWDGAGACLELFAPIPLIAALAPRSDGPPAFTLSKPMNLPGLMGAPLTFRSAYADHRDLLMERVIGYLGTTKVLEELRKFGAPARGVEGGTFNISPMTPREVAQVFAFLAASGDAGRIRPGVEIIGGPGVPLERPKPIKVDQVGLFIVNHLLKEPDALSKSDGKRRYHAASLVTATDSAGLWCIAYRNDALALVRLPGDSVSHKGATDFVENLLPDADGHAADIRPPEGIVFSKVCAKSGLKALSLCPKVINEPFVKGTEPREWCPLIYHGR
jgi:penicillin-binding protein 1B